MGECGRTSFVVHQTRGRAPTRALQGSLTSRTRGPSPQLWYSMRYWRATLGAKRKSKLLHQEVQEGVASFFQKDFQGDDGCEPGERPGRARRMPRYERQWQAEVTYRTRLEVAYNIGAAETEQRNLQAEMTKEFKEALGGGPVRACFMRHHR